MFNNKPFLLRPAAKDYIWGGSRLNDDFGKSINISPLAETWECSTHNDGQSIIASGNLSGILLSEALNNNPHWLGNHPLTLTGGKPTLPILVKLIDAKSDLSIQVHPDDKYALKNEGSLGKSEMWYILAADRGSELVFGFNQDMTEDSIRKALSEGNLTDYLNHVPVHKDDVFFIEAGTVHAIGAGCLIAEIQQSSNITYRLYDYGRLDNYGNPRPLHIDKAIEVANLKSSSEPRQPMRVLKYRNGSASELLTSCKYFCVERLLLNTESRKYAGIQTGSNSFHVLLCYDGCGVIFSDDLIIPFFKGDCIFVPAESIPLKLHGKAQLLNISC